MFWRCFESPQPWGHLSVCPDSSSPALACWLLEPVHAIQDFFQQRSVSFSALPGGTERFPHTGQPGLGPEVRLARSAGWTPQKLEECRPAKPLLLVLCYRIRGDILAPGRHVHKVRAEILSHTAASMGRRPPAAAGERFTHCMGWVPQMQMHSLHSRAPAGCPNMMIPGLLLFSCRSGSPVGGGVPSPPCRCEFQLAAGLDTSS